MIRFGSTRVSGSILDELVSNVGSDMDLDHSVRISSLGLVLPGLLIFLKITREHVIFYNIA